MATSVCDYRWRRRPGNGVSWMLLAPDGFWSPVLPYSCYCSLMAAIPLWLLVSEKAGGNVALKMEQAQKIVLGKHCRGRRNVKRIYFSSRISYHS